MFSNKNQILGRTFLAAVIVSAVWASSLTLQGASAGVFSDDYLEAYSKQAQALIDAEQAKKKGALKVEETALLRARQEAYKMEQMQNDYQKKSAAYDAKRKPLEQKMKALEAELVKAQAAHTEAKKAYDASGKKSKEGFLGIKFTPKEEKDYLEATETLTEAQRKVTDAVSELDGMQQAHSQELATLAVDEDALDKAKQYRDRLEKEIDGKREAAKLRLSEEEVAARAAADAFYAKQKDDYYDAKFFMMDLDTMKTKYELTDSKIGALKMQLDQQLQKTLLGQFIDQQIQKAFKGFCSMQEACQAKNPEAVVQKLDECLKAPLSGKPSCE